MNRLILCVLWVALSCSAQPLYRFAVDQDRLAGAPDFSFLNKPLTPADRLFVRDAHFYRVGADLRPNTRDDERVRLFGVNLAFGANFPEQRDAERIAKRLRKLGVNLVRLHHMDSSPDRDPNEARSILTTGPYPTLNPVAVDRLRRFLAALKGQGIYVNLNLHVGYTFRPDVDKIPPLPGGLEIPRQSKPLHIFYPRMIELQQEYTRSVLDALGLRRDPVLGMVEIDNESSLVEAFQRGNLQKYALGEYKAELDRQWEKFRSSGADDYLLFLADRDRYYLDAMRKTVLANTDPLVPVAGTQMGFGGLLNLDSHAGMDYQDNHFYVDHYNFPNQAWDARDWRIRNSSAVGTGLAAFLNMAAARQAGRPYTVSEFNQQWPNQHGAEIDPTLSAFAAFQDWDALMHFAYSHGRSWDTQTPGGFDINGDWAKWPNFGQSAWLFRTGAIQAAKRLVTVPASRELRLKSAREKRGGNVARAMEDGGYAPALALLHRVAVEPAERTIAEASTGAAPYRSDTGELFYDPDRKILTIAAGRVAGVFGFIGEQKITAGAIGVELGKGGRGFVTLLVTPLDGREIQRSERLLVSLPGYALGSVPGSDPPRPQKLVPYAGLADWWTAEPDPGSNQPSGNRGGSPPAWMERVECFLTLRTDARRLAVVPLDGAGSPLPALSDVQPAGGGFRIHLDAAAPWYEIKRTSH